MTFSCIMVKFEIVSLLSACPGSVVVVVLSMATEWLFVIHTLLILLEACQGILMFVNETRALLTLNFAANSSKLKFTVGSEAIKRFLAFLLDAGQTSFLSVVELQHCSSKNTAIFTKTKIKRNRTFIRILFHNPHENTIFKSESRSIASTLEYEHFQSNLIWCCCIPSNQ